MSLDVIAEEEMVDVSFPKPQADGTYADAKGGTEMMAERITDILERNGLDDKINVIHSRVREDSIDLSKKNILLLHDTCDDPEAAHLSKPSSRNKFDKIVFVSNHQMQSFHYQHALRYKETHVIHNAIDPIVLTEPKPTERINLIYHTTPHRGLEILVPCFEWICNHFKDQVELHLDVYSSFNAYGWADRDIPYKGLFEKVDSHPNMTYHGYQPNDVVREALKQAHIFAYPNIWQETSCIAAIEAMSAGCEIVCPNHAALPETTAGFATMYQYHEDPNAHAHTFIEAMVNAIHSHRSAGQQSKLEMAKVYIDNFYNWSYRESEWLQLFSKLLRE